MPSGALYGFGSLRPHDYHGCGWLEITPLENTLAVSKQKYLNSIIFTSSLPSDQTVHNH